MLGLRRVQGCQIDLHQGDPALFDHDFAVPADVAVARGLAAAAEAGVRHVVVMPGEPADQVMAAVKAFALSGARGKVARVTFILGDASGYRRFQTALFGAFPEDAP